MLDIDILSDPVRNPADVAAKRLAEVAEEAVATSVIVVAELHYGAIKRASTPLERARGNSKKLGEGDEWKVRARPA